MDEKTLSMSSTPNLDKVVQRLCESAARNQARQEEREQRIAEYERDPFVKEVLGICRNGCGLYLDELLTALHVGRVASARSAHEDKELDACAAAYLAGKIAGIRGERAKRRRQEAVQS